mmetsp:Transcript_13164/g.16400  ORF Transcript_13164/g.16400 Transcript_13164/m.16400 type:complete len:107 (+) Transcript_13164:104-424(+)
MMCKPNKHHIHHGARRFNVILIMELGGCLGKGLTKFIKDFGKRLDGISIHLKMNPGYTAPNLPQIEMQNCFGIHESKTHSQQILQRSEESEERNYEGNIEYDERYL